MIFNDLYQNILLSLKILEGGAGKFKKVTIVCVLVALLELLNVGLVFPFLTLMLKPELIETSHIIRQIYDAMKFQSAKSFTIACGGLVLLIVLILNLVIFYKNKLVAKFSAGQMTALSTKLLQTFMNKPLTFFVDGNTGKMSKDVIEQSDAYSNQVIVSIAGIMSDGMALLALLAFMIYLDPMVSLVMLVSVAVVVSGLGAITKVRIIKFGALSDQLNSQRFAMVISNLQAIKEIKAYKKERHFVEAFAKIAEQMAKAYSRLIVTQQLPSFVLQTAAPFIVVGLSIYYVIVDADLREIVPVLGVYAVLGYKLLPYMTRLTSAITNLRQNSKIIENIHGLLSTENVKQGGNSSANDVTPRVPRIEFKGVGFQYVNGRREVLDEISFCIQPNTFVCVVGVSGAGKTTLIDLMLGMLEPTKGSIEINGVSTRDIDEMQLAQLFGYVHQNPMLLDTTLRENIAFGVNANEIDNTKVERAIDFVHLRSQVARMPEGVDTMIGERGSRLSGGQKQRVGIARALYIEPKILVLDESTNALDKATEQEVIQNIIELKKHCTIVAIAHTRAMISQCDAVVMLDSGKINYMGPYSSILENSEEFRKLMAQAQTTEIHSQ